MNSSCAVLIATQNRRAQLQATALACVRNQTTATSRVVIVNDGEPFTQGQETNLQAAVPAAHVTIIQNARAPGAAGAWNTGLAHLVAQEENGSAGG